MYCSDTYCGTRRNLRSVAIEWFNQTWFCSLNIFTKTLGIVFYANTLIVIIEDFPGLGVFFIGTINKCDVLALASHQITNASAYLFFRGSGCFRVRRLPPRLWKLRNSVAMLFCLSPPDFLLST